MKIGIDIDGVLTNYHQYTMEKGKEYCQNYKINSNFFSNELSTKKMFNWSYYNEAKFWITHIFDYAKNNPVIKNAPNEISRLKEENNEIYIITSRWLASTKCEKSLFSILFWKRKMRKIVKKWLQVNGIIYDHIVFLKKKEKYVKKNKIDIMIEDNPKNIKGLSKITKVICYHWEYNEGIEGKNIYRCYNWNEIYHKIHELCDYH